jgi:hypothetical protein
LICNRERAVKTFYVIGLLAAFALAGCVDIEQVRVDAIKQAKSHCESEGKQFVLNNVEEKSAPNATGTQMVVVSGHCVGPGEPGYQTP